MLIDELLYEQDGTLTKAAKGLTKGLVKGAGEFIKGARGGKDIVNPLTGKSVFSYGDDTEKTTRSVGANLPPHQQFKNLLKNVYGENLTDEIVDDWEEAIKSNNDSKVAAVGKKYRHDQKREGDWKRSNRDIVRALMDYYEKNPNKSPVEKPEDDEKL